MKVYSFEGKKIEDIKEQIYEELKQTEENLIIYEREVKGGLFKTKKIEVDVLIVDEVIEFVKEYLKKIAVLMNIDLNIEVRKREKNISFLLHSDQNNILIGRNGRTIDALQTIIKQAIYNKTKVYVNINFDVGGYKQNQIGRIERLAINIARDVARTRVEVQLDSMNSYERRIVHAMLSEHEHVYTQSIGEEPNRCVVIKPKGE